jgi:hypothetical protein
LPRPSQPLVPHPTWAFYSHSELQATLEVGKEVKNAIGKNLEAIFYSVGVDMNRQQAKANSRATFVYKTDAELDTMPTKNILEYEKFCWDGWKKVIQNDDTNRRFVCVLVSKFLTYFMIVYF